MLSLRGDGVNPPVPGLFSLSGLAVYNPENFFFRASAIIAAGSLTLQGRGFSRTGVPPGDLINIIYRYIYYINCKYSCSKLFLTSIK